MNEHSKSPLQEALIDSILKDYDKMLAGSHPVGPSAALNAWAKNKIKTKKAYLYHRRALRGLLIAVLILALLAVSAMAVPAIRKAFVQFFLNAQEDHIAVTFDPSQAANAPRTIEAPYTLGYIPSAYIHKESSASLTLNATLWIAGDGSYIQFTQRTLPDNPTLDNWTGLDYSQAPISTSVQNYYLQIIECAENNLWVWTNNEYVFTLDIPASMPEEDVLKIISSCAPSVP